MKFLRALLFVHLRTIVFVLALNAMLGAALWALSPSTRHSSHEQLALKARAVRVFEAERGNPSRDFAFLAALSNALKFRQFERVEELLNQYDLGHNI